jgi:hypothetical protein
MILVDSGVHAAARIANKSGCSRSKPFALIGCSLIWTHGAGSPARMRRTL